MNALFGRDRELAEASGALERVLGGSGATLFLVGEPGIGKSRIAEELADRAQLKGASVHWGRGWEGGGAPAYWPWTEALTSMTDGLDATHLAALVGEDGPELVHVLPRLRARLPHLEGAVLPGADEGRFRLASAVLATLKRAAALRPRAVILDDLHLADGPTLSCLQLVMRSLRGAPVLLIGTWRDAEVRLSPVLSERLGALARDATTLQLGALERPAALALIAERSSLKGAVAESIANTTGGNPLFLNELSRLVAARGEGQALPLGIQESIRQRLSLLPAEAVQVLELAACAGRELDTPVLAQALAVTPVELLGQLERATLAGVLMQRAKQYAFSHDLIREVLERGLTAATRAAHHQKLAEALTALGRSSVEGRAAIAHHLLEAAEVAPGPAIVAAIDAARASLDVLAFEHALDLLQRAQTVASRGAVDSKLVSRLWTALGEARVRAGEAPAGKDACAEAMRIARELKDGALMAAAALAWGSEIQPGTVDRELVGWLQDARAALGDEEPLLKARVFARLAAALQPSPKPQEQIDMALEAIALARESGDERTLLEVLHAGMAALMDFAHPARRLPLNLEQEALAQRFHDQPRELRARLRLVFDYHALGDIPLADARAHSFAALAQQLRQTRFAWFLPAWKAARATFEGRFSEVPALLDEADALQPPGPMRNVRKFAQRLELARVREDAATVISLEAEMRAAWTGMELGEFMSRMLYGAALARVGEPERAKQVLEPLDTPAKAHLLFCLDGSTLSLLTEVGPFFASARPRLYANALPLAGAYGSVGVIGMAWGGPIDRALALLSGLDGKLDLAVQHAENALASIARIGGRGVLARSYLEAAELRLRRGSKEDATIAQRHLGAGRALAVELGQVALLPRFDALGSAAAPAPVSALPAPPQATTLKLEREGDAWAITGTGPAFRLKDSRGLQMLARLVERPDQEVHCLELASDGARGEIDGGDSGELLDADAKRQYRTRMEELQEELREAEDFGDAHRARRAQDELEFLAAELARAVGLGGRSRKGSSATERARVAVQRRLKDAVSRIAEHDPEVGRHLAWALKTGTYCCYRPRR